MYVYLCREKKTNEIQRKKSYPSYVYKYLQNQNVNGQLNCGLWILKLKRERESELRTYCFEKFEGKLRGKRKNVNFCYKHLKRNFEKSTVNQNQ